MNLVIILAYENHLQSIKQNQSMLDICFYNYQKMKEVNNFVICVHKKNIEKLQHLKNNNVFFSEIKSDRNHTLIAAIETFEQHYKMNQDDNIIIHEANYANTEHRIIQDLISKSKYANFINTILPIENSFSMISENASQFLIKNKKEVYLLQSPQLLHFDLFKYMYMNKEKVQINMRSILGSKYNFDLEDDLLLKLFLTL